MLWTAALRLSVWPLKSSGGGGPYKSDDAPLGSLPQSMLSASPLPLIPPAHAPSSSSKGKKAQQAQVAQTQQAQSQAAASATVGVSVGAGVPVPPVEMEPEIK
jgi:hypothetical protein